MISGLKKDHHTLLDLLLSHIHATNSNLIDLFDSLIEAFDNDNNTKLLECIYIKNVLSSVSISEEYLKNVSLSDYQLILDELKNEVLPIYAMVIKVIKSIIEDHQKRLEFKLPISSLSKGLIYTINEQDLEIEIFQSIDNLLIRFESLLLKSKFQTKFCHSDYAKTDIVIIGFDSYEQEYERLLDDLFEFKQSLNAWSGMIRKSSPCFIEYVETNDQDIEAEDYSVFMDSFEMDSFEEFSIERKENLGIPYRVVFGN